MIFLFVFILSFFLVYVVKQLCFKFSFLDYPNNRSSHTTPTALSGGVGFILAFFIGVLICIFQEPSFIIFLNILLISLVVAFIGLWDDLRNLSSTFRFIFQILAASLIYFSGVKLSLIELPFITINLSLINYLVTVFFIVSLTNIYNFMDGIDGYAGGVGVLGGLFLGFLSLITGEYSLAMILFLLSVSLLGFLVWNFPLPKATIFMGDVGSSFLGFFFASVSVYLVQSANEITIVIPLLIFGVFVVDATVTLLWRLMKRKKVWEAHRDHFYQKLHRGGWVHRKILLLEGVHMVFILGLSYLYFLSGDFLRILILFFVSFMFVLKFFWIVKASKRNIKY